MHIKQGKFVKLYCQILPSCRNYTRKFKETSGKPLQILFQLKSLKTQEQNYCMHVAMSKIIHAFLVIFKGLCSKYLSSFKIFPYFQFNSVSKILWL